MESKPLKKHLQHFTQSPSLNHCQRIRKNDQVLEDFFTRSIVIFLLMFPGVLFPQTSDSLRDSHSAWHLSIQYLGLTYHPDGGNTPEVYPLKLDRKAYLVLDVGAAVKLDYRLSEFSFLRFTSAIYQDCAFVTAGCFHAGPRLQYSWGDNQVNAGMGPILSFRQDWHRFKEYQDDEFYGKRIYKGWQYRFFWYAVEFEYLRRLNDRMEFQWSLIPGTPLIITSMVGIRWSL